MIKPILQRYRYSVILLKQLVITDFKLRYKGSFLGYVWTLLRPLALFVILYIVFVNFLRVGESIPHFAVYLLLGIILWNYFTEVTTNGLSAVVGKGDIMRKLDFPRYIIVIAGSVSALINLGINLVVLVLFILFNGVPLTIEAFWLIPLIVELFIFALSIAFLLSALFVKFRDINYIWEVVLQAGFYATPVLYPVQLVVQKSVWAAQILSLNPVAQVIQDARHVVITPASMTLPVLFGNWLIYLVPFCVVAVISVVSIIYFKRRSPYFAEEI